MDKLCGQTVSLDGDSLPGIFFSLTSGKYRPNFQCILTIKGAVGNQRIIIVVEKMDVACGGTDRLSIYDGRVDPSSLLNRNNSLQCGSNKYYFRVNH